jgi:hypothetical protein
MSSRVLVVTADHVGHRMAGPAIRAVNLARELARLGFEVTLAAPNGTDASIADVSSTRLDPRDAGGTTALASAHDAVVAQRLPAAATISLAGSDTRIVYDLYDHVPHELLAAAHARSPKASDELDLTRHRLWLETVLRAGDSFICASERQRDLWLGALGVLGRLEHAGHERDSSFRDLIEVVPFGIEAEPPAPDGSGHRGVLPGVGERSKVLIWGGGICNWLDPLTAIRAVHELSSTREEVRLVFMGLERPNSQVAETSMADRAVALARELGVLGTNVVFNREWVPYEERGTWLAQADIGVSAHFDTLETRYAFRTRLLDYLWAGLPIVATEGDVLSDLVREKRLGATVRAGDVAGWVSALMQLLGDDKILRSTAERVAVERKRFLWSVVVQPLARLLTQPSQPRYLPRSARLRALHADYLSARSSLARRGIRGTLEAFFERRPRRTARLP